MFGPLLNSSIKVTFFLVNDNFLKSILKMQKSFKPSQQSLEFRAVEWAAVGQDQDMGMETEKSIEIGKITMKLHHTMPI